jgi:hypothetical protein
MSNDDRYNGWTNYETWCVHLWLSNEEGSYRHWREEAERHRKDAERHANVRRGILTVEEESRYRLGESIKESFEESHPFRGEFPAMAFAPCVYCDLLDSALSQVDWYEVADAFLEEHDQAEEPTHDNEREEAPSRPLFELGRILTTPGALETLSSDEIADALARHHGGDWGDVDEEDWRENRMSLHDGCRLFSVYHSKTGVEFWVITEADRSTTTVLLPSEY